MNEQKPTDLEAEIVKFTALVEMYAVPPREMDNKEKAQLKKLKVLLEKLTPSGGGFTTTAGIFVGQGNNNPFSVDRLTAEDVGL